MAYNVGMTHLAKRPDILMTSQPARAAAPQLPILLQENVGSIRLLTLNRPAARNSLSEGLIAELHGALKQIHDDNSVRAVVIPANGPAFSAGHDMKELTERRSDADRGRAYFGQIMNACSAMMQAVVHLPKPVVAAVQGIATAAGCQLVASCDLAVASEAAGFATPGVDIGLFSSTPMVALSRNLPPSSVRRGWGAPAPRPAKRGRGMCGLGGSRLRRRRQRISASSTASWPPA